MLVFMVRRLEGFSLHDHFEKDITTSKEIDLISMVDAFLRLVGKLGGIILDGPDGLGGIKVNFIVLVVDKVAGAAEVSEFQVHMFVNKNVLGFDVTMGKPRPM